MTAIGSTTPTTPTSTTGTQANGNPKGTLGKDDFLKLLVTQLRYQDPLSPLDQNQFLAQTAQFTALEQLQNIGRTLDELKQTAAASGLTQRASLLGRTITAAGRGITLGSTGAGVPLTFTLDAPSSVTAEVLDAQGSVVRRLATTGIGAGAASIAWDGLDDTGRFVSPGDYFYRVGAAGGATAVAARGTASGLRFENGQPRFTVAGATIREDDIIGLA